MITIRFRAKRVKYGSWYYGSLLTCQDGTAAIMTAQHTWMSTHVTVDPKTIGQFTGLTDEDQHDIYEGDIIKIVEEYDDENVYTSIGVVCFVEGIYELQDKNGKHFAYLGWTMHNEDVIKLEVVGNIHDNPEMLEEGGKK